MVHSPTKSGLEAIVEADRPCHNGIDCKELTGFTCQKQQCNFPVVEDPTLVSMVYLPGAAGPNPTSLDSYILWDRLQEAARCGSTGGGMRRASGMRNYVTWMKWQHSW